MLSIVLCIIPVLDCAWISMLYSMSMPISANMYHMFGFAMRICFIRMLLVRSMHGLSPMCHSDWYDSRVYFLCSNFLLRNIAFNNGTVRVLLMCGVSDLFSDTCFTISNVSASLLSWIHLHL